MSHRPRANEPRWVRELAEEVLGPARYQASTRVNTLIAEAAEEHGVAGKELAIRVAKEWARRGWVADWRLPVEVA